jgi:hypothetical protein
VTGELQNAAYDEGHDPLAAATNWKPYPGGCFPSIHYYGTQPLHPLPPLRARFAVSWIGNFTLGIEERGAD